MTSPTPLLREALATALRDGGYVRSVARRYGHFNDVYWDQSADAILAHPSMQAVAEHEWTDSALDLQTERDLAEAYYPTLERHLREHGCDHDFAEVANADGVLGGVDAPVTSWADHDFKPMRTGTIGSPCQWCGKPGLQHRAALGPSEGERTDG